MERHFIKQIAVASRVAGDDSVPGPKYFEALARFGAKGEFVALPDPVRAAGHYDALLLGGGGDLHPSYCAADPSSPAANTRLIRSVFPARDESEIRLVRAFLERGKRVLGVCRGIQVLAAALGGTILPHLPDCSGLCHDNEQLGHAVTVFPPSALVSDGACRGIPCARLWVNSAHHQAVADPGPLLRPFALADDEIVEGLYLPDLALGLQWHPERMAGTCCDAIWRWFLGE